MIEYEYLVCNEYGDVMFAYDNEEDALTQTFKYDGWSLSRQAREVEEDEQDT
jgi:hypothetical protein